jgi:thiamine-monophosphate kinase
MPLSERELIESIARKSAGGSSKLIATGIGDDCAVLRLPEGSEMLVTTDFSLEWVHFRRAWHPADSVGHRCLARGLSDIAAMGGEPVAAFLSLALPGDLPQRWVDQFVAGMLLLAQRFGVTLAGGDTAQSYIPTNGKSPLAGDPAAGGIVADIAVVGSVPAGQAILRSGARPGDSIFVSGELGAAVAVLEQMVENPERKFRAAAFPAHFYPEPQLAVARHLRQKKLATAMIDISDGLSTDLRHICESSGVGATLVEQAIPTARMGRHEVELRHALHGGDEYQLVFTVAPGRRVPPEIAGVPLTRIGYINEEDGVFIDHENGYRTELEARGWEHFSGSTSAGGRFAKGKPAWQRRGARRGDG